MDISKLKPGMTVYDVHRRKMGNTNMSTVGVWTVLIVAVDPDGRWVEAKWNGNAQRRYFSSSVKSWRLNKPVLVKSGFGHRLASRAELKALKEKDTP
jgi:hypothetical protein